MKAGRYPPGTPYTALDPQLRPQYAHARQPPATDRTLYSLTYTPADEANFKRTATILRMLLKHAPRRLHKGTNQRFFEWIARTERQRIKHGKPTPRLAVPGTDA